MSGAVKGKGVIMKKITCVEFDEKMKSEDFVKQLVDVNFELLAKHSTLFTLISIEIDLSNECEYQEAENDN